MSEQLPARSVDACSSSPARVPLFRSGAIALAALLAVPSQSAQAQHPAPVATVPGGGKTARPTVADAPLTLEEWRQRATMSRAMDRWLDRKPPAAVSHASAEALLVVPIPVEEKPDLHGRTLEQWIGDFGDERFDVRDRASRIVEKFLRQTDEWKKYAPILQKAVQHPDPEVARRAEGARVALEGILPPGMRRWPWIDMLPEEYPGRDRIIQTFHGRAKAEGYRDSSCTGDCAWRSYGRATELLIDALHAQGVPRSELRKLLWQMQERGREYCRGHKIPWD